MIPCRAEAENTAPCRLDDGGPLLDWLADEGVTSRQASLIIGFTIVTRGGVGTCARWTRIRRVLTHAVSLCGAVGRLARALGSFVTCLLAAVTPILGIRLLRGPLDSSSYCFCVCRLAVMKVAIISSSNFFLILSSDAMAIYLCPLALLGSLPRNILSVGVWLRASSWSTLARSLYTVLQHR